ncbi:MAG TPA: hypothetical protein VL651_01410 [Bacteroidia bacterium]|jgi:hypothetical protein|nr:hypothetical protein [Bacteroidia bacterium]
MKNLFAVLLSAYSLPSHSQVNSGSIEPTTSHKTEILVGILSVAGSNRLFPKNDNTSSYGAYESSYFSKNTNYYSGFGVYSRISGMVGYGEVDIEGGIHREDLTFFLYNFGYGNHGSCQDSYSDRYRLQQNIFELKTTFLGGVKWFSQNKRFNFETAIGFHLMSDHKLKTFIDEEEEIDSGTCIQDTSYRIGPASIKMNTDYDMKIGFTFKAGLSIKCSDHICIHLTGGARNSDHLFYFKPYEYRLELFSTIGCCYVFNPIKR